MSSNKVAHNLPNEARSAKGNIEKVGDVDKCMVGAQGTMTCVSEEERNSLVAVELGENVLKAHGVGWQSEIIASNVNEPSNSELSVTSGGYLKMINNNNRNVINYNGKCYAEGKIYPNYVVKCEEDSLDNILHKVTETHEEIMKHSAKMNVFECNICEYFYRTIEEFYSHLKSNHRADRIKFMNVEFLSHILLTVSKHHSAKVFKIQCPKCEVTLQNNTILKQHRMKTCFQCTTCKENFDDCLNWKKHMILCNSGGHVVCNCGIRFPNHTYYEKHMASCKEPRPMAHFCVICKSFFSGEHNFLVHLKSLHPEQTSRKIVIPFSTCRICNMRYVSNMELHNCEDFFKCPVCLTPFTSEMLRDTHLNAVITDDASCAICKKIFLANCEKQLHDCDKECTSSTLFICKICHKSLTSSDEMYRHLKAYHMQTVLSVKHHASMSCNDFNPNECMKGKIFESEEENESSIKSESLYVSKMQRHKDICTRTYAKKKIVFNRARLHNNRYYSGKRKNYFQKTLDIKNEETGNLDSVETCVFKGTRKKNHSQTSIDNDKIEQTLNVNEGNYQLTHLLKKHHQKDAHVERTEDFGGAQEDESFIRGSVKKLEEAEFYLGEKCSNDRTEERVVEDKETSIFNCGSMEEHTQKNLVTVCKEETDDGYGEQNSKILKSLAINEKSSCSLMGIRYDLKTEPSTEFFDDDLFKRKNNLTTEINIKKEEIDDIDEDVRYIKEEEEKQAHSKEVADDFIEERIGYNSQVFDGTNEHINNVDSVEIAEIENITKEENGNFAEETYFGKVIEEDDTNTKICPSFIYSRRNSQMDTKTMWKDVIDFEEGDIHVNQNFVTDEKLRTNDSSLQKVKSEIKREGQIEEYIVMISDEPTQELKIVNVMGTETSHELNDKPSPEELSMNNESIASLILPEIVADKQETSGYKSETHETCVSQRGLMADKEHDPYYDDKHGHFGTDIKNTDFDFMSQKYTCTLCYVPFYNLASYYDHYVYHNLAQHQCPYCKVKFNQVSFYKHCSMHAILNYEKSITTNTTLIMKCKRCSQEIRKGDLLSHYEKHSLICLEGRDKALPKSVVNTIINDLKREGKLCVLCQKNFEDLKQHLIEHLYADAHANRDETGRVFCQICKKPLSNKCEYKKHILHHESPSVYWCEICPKLYKTRGYFLNHKKKHLGDCGVIIEKENSYRRKS